MAHSVLIDPLLIINNGADFDCSDHVKQLNLAHSTAALDNTAGSATPIEVFLAGLRNSRFSARLFQDFADNEVDEILFNAWQNRTTLALRLRADKTSAISASNPEYQFSCFITAYSGINASIGEVVMCDLEVAMTTDVTRDITP